MVPEILMFSYLRSLALLAVHLRPFHRSFESFLCEKPMKPILVAGILLSLISSSHLAEAKDGSVQTKSAAAEKVHFKARPFDLKQIRLLSGPMKDLVDRNREYLLSLSVDRLVHNFRVNAGLPSKAEPLSGWEAPNCELRGHFTGHFMSACALMYAATGDERLKEKGKHVVDALAKCQQALGFAGYLSAYPEEMIDRVEGGKRVWAPYYTLHKIMAGLFDLYTMCDNQQALDVLTKMASWVKMRTDRLDEKQMQAMLKVEFGGMAEILANLYGITGDPAHLALTRRFEKRSFIDPLIDHKDQLKGLHVNTHIPQVIGAAREYELTGDKQYFEAASYFWNEVVDVRSYATGGTSNYEYWREDPHHLSDQLSQESHENCCTYNMLKLTDHLFSWSADARFADYYERALFSAILPTHHPDVGGAIMYYVPLKSGLFKMFGIPDSSYFCCNGSGIESFAKLGSSICFKSEQGVYVNLFVSSEVQWTEKGATIRQETRFPEEQGTTITVKLRSSQDFTLFIRIPSWTTDKFEVKLNGKAQHVTANARGYVELHRKWSNGDRVQLHLPMDLKLSRFPDDPTVSAILYGPVVLAGALGNEAMTKEMQRGLGLPDVHRMVSQGAAIPVPSLVVSNPDPNTWIKPVKGKPLTFQTVGSGKPKDVTLIPFYKIFGQRYAVYWNVYTPQEWQALQDSRPRLAPGVLDRVLVGDQRSDRDHNFQAWRFEKGERNGRKWVKSPLSFRYDVTVEPDQANKLACVFGGGEKESAFDVLVDGVKIVTESIGTSKETEIVERKYDIPRELVGGKQRVAITFRARNNKPTAELYDCVVSRPKD